MKHRNEIDGLRALAVLPVILFHAGFSLFSGGFVGVDIFFVISGYLITGILLAELAQGNFSIARFYARRARRILPALFVVTLACIPFAFAWMLPAQYEEFSRSLPAVLLFMSNIFFWRESGYFAAEASEKPLLHTWSLGVEEQYYLLFPLALWLLWRMGKQRAFYGVAAAALLSLLLCEYASRYYINVNFFLLPTRAWELFAGALCAFCVANTGAKKHNFFALLGLGLIGVSVFTYAEYMRLPSAYTLVPVLGTVLILRYGTADSWVARLLSWRPLVGVGLISYSAYLWHQPIFAFARIHMLNTPSHITMLGLAVASLLLGAVTWQLVEQPFRIKQHPRYVGNARALVLAFALAGVLLAAGAYGYLTHGRLAYWTQHTPSNQVRAFHLIEASKGEEFYDNGDCIFRTSALGADLQARIVGCQKKYGKGIALIGDSHGINLFFVAKEKAGKRPFIVGIARGMCRAHSPQAFCYYNAFTALVENHPNLFSDIVYEQAGWHLFTDTRGEELAQDALSGVPLDATMPLFDVNIPHIDAVTHYLANLARFSRVTWLGPRMEPEIREADMVRFGCDHRFHLRTGQAELFEQFDAVIPARLTATPVHYRSQIDLAQFDMAQDFINCDATYFVDRSHYSLAGAKHFGARITLDKILDKAGAP